jgi:hypothetical protein
VVFSSPRKRKNIPIAGILINPGNHGEQQWKTGTSSVFDSGEQLLLTVFTVPFQNNERLAVCESSINHNHQQQCSAAVMINE